MTANGQEAYECLYALLRLERKRADVLDVLLTRSMTLNSRLAAYDRDWWPAYRALADEVERLRLATKLVREGDQYE